MVQTTGTVTDWSSEYKKDVEKMMEFFGQKSPNDIIRGMLVWDSVPDLLMKDITYSISPEYLGSSSISGLTKDNFNPTKATEKLLEISKTTKDPIGFLGFVFFLTSEISKEYRFYKESKTNLFMKSILIKKITDILKLFPKDVAMDFIDKFLGDNEYQLLQRKILEVVVLIEDQLIKNKYVEDIYSMVSIASNLRIKIDRLFSRQILFYNKSWNQVLWCEKAKLAGSHYDFDKNRHLILDLGSSKFCDFYSCEEMSYEKLQIIGQLLNLAIVLLDGDCKNLKDMLSENSDFWVDLFAKKSKEVVASNFLLPVGVTDEVRSAVFFAQLPAYDQIVKEYNKTDNL